MISNAVPIDPTTRDKMQQWLVEQFTLRNVAAKVREDAVRQETSWLMVVPVHIEGILNNQESDPSYLEYIKDGDRTIYVKGALGMHDRASLLQEVEDAWNNQDPEPEIQLVLRPSAH